MLVGGHDAWAQVTRGTAERLALGAGDTVHVRAATGAKTLPAAAAA
jgi:sulfate transport system ATP-binding protein